MSKQVMLSINDNPGNSSQTTQSSQPHWMAQWMRTSSNATAERRDDSAGGNKELHRVSGGDHITIEGDTESRRMSSRGLSNEGLHGQDTDEIRARRPFIDQHLDSGDAINRKGGIQLSSGSLAANENSSREYRFITEGTSRKPLERTKAHFSTIERSSSTPMPSQERFARPSTHLVPYHDLERYKLDKGKAVLCPSISRPSVVPNDQLPHTRTKIMGQEHCDKHFQSALIWERKMGSQPEPDTGMDDHHKLKTGQDWFQTMQKCSHMTSLLHSRCIAPEKNEQKVSLYDQYPLAQFPSCVQKTMKICTTVDAVEATPGGCPLFSQTTHSLLITKKTDVNVSKETDMFRRFITQMNGNSSSYLDNITPFFGQASRAVKLQPISSYSSEEQGNVGSVGTSKLSSKNESSAETDTLNLDFAIPNSGANSTHSTKVYNFGKNLFPRIDVASSREVGRSWTSTGLLDINLELPALPAVASSSEDVPTSSRTQSLEVDNLLSQAEQPEPKFSLSPEADPSARWVKRLKSSCDSRGTKISNMAENSSHEKKGVFFRSVLKKGIASSVPTPKECRVKEISLPNRSGNLSKEDEHFSPDQPKKSMLSHVWIKRWLSNGSQISQRKPETLVVCEPQCSKLPLDDLQKRQFPSIAAIAMMGKSMSSFQSCEFQKRGSFTVWNTKAF